MGAEGRHADQLDPNRLAGWCFFALLALVGPAAWAEDANERVRVADPYLELHTGPGRGYPIFDIAERGERVEILGRHTDWFKVKTARGKQGWVSRAQMEATLTEAGEKKTFRDVLFDDYLARRMEFGFSFGELKHDPLLSAYAGYRLHANFVAELTIAQSAGEFSTTSLYYVSLVSQPFPESRWSPFFSLGAGRFTNVPKATLVSAVETSGGLANAAIGLRYYITRQFFLRAEAKRHVALVSYAGADRYNEFSAGAAFFF
ncbi:MAG TPA: SH3 domain-containing protein [Burkholderiales bacterium]|nr:SH3 domain-containing protein [Burkholderiales bacterium]